MGEPIQNLLADQSVTELPLDPAAAKLAAGQDLLRVVQQHPESCLVWALLAEQGLAQQELAADVAAYAYARTGYHRGLDALRRNGWRGSGLIPWEHEPNQGFLRALWALSQAAGRLGETEEQQRTAQFLRDSSETAWQARKPA